ncbi:PREDICTED: clytin-like [Amphimedon queenslandica]|uniref:EF-hand domain-containing protein n=1 Tax=Amphimedon queenslandica TaxID=400682 RepID=A0A1X7V523_AMPQE|nr:PREDICTED: clytin-like [Amphimedon queenslandica]|eukprot:XP_011403237.1 PREDICTED: clytin-like [Amphimedon queenslandica]
MPAKAEDYLKNKKWVERINGMFVLMDKNKNGFLSEEDWFVTADKLAKTVPDRPEELARVNKTKLEFFAALGVKNGQQVAKDQFVEVIAAFVAKQMEARSQGKETLIEKYDNAVFDLVDYNHDGTLSWEEYKAVMVAGGFVTEESARSGFETLDKNKNGKIERKEYIEADVKFWCNLEDSADGLFGAEL